MSNATLRIRPVRDDRMMKLFIEIPFRIYAKVDHWISQPRMAVRDLLNRNKHPFHEHAQVEYFLAFRDRECVGRIAAIENFAHNQFHGEKIGFFGFLDAQADAEIFRALLAEAEAWCRARGLSAMRGPCSFSTNEECGALVMGFDALPTVMMPWNPESYPRHIEAAGYAKAKDLYSWWVDEDNYDERLHRIADRVREKISGRDKKVSVVSRAVNMGRFAAELELVRKVYNSAWEKNWGFVPMTRAEIDFMAKELKPLLLPELLRFIEVDGEPVAFALTLPDYNMILRHLKGRLGPAEIALFLLLRKRIHTIRMLTMGVVKEFRGRGLESILISDTVRECRRIGFAAADMGWILEDNVLMNRTLQSLGGRHYKTHRIYEKAL